MDCLTLQKRFADPFPRHLPEGLLHIIYAVFLCILRYYYEKSDTCFQREVDMGSSRSKTDNGKASRTAAGRALSLPSPGSPPPAPPQAGWSHRTQDTQLHVNSR